MKTTQIDQAANQQTAFLLDFDLHRKDTRPFGRSLRLLLEAAIREHHAHAAYLYQHSEIQGVLALRLRTGNAEQRLENARIQLSVDASRWLVGLSASESIDHPSSDYRAGSFPEVILHGLKSISVVPLRQEGRLLGIITVGWLDDGARFSQLENLDKLAAAAAALLHREHQVSSTLYLASRVAALEAELADLKIAERTNGILSGVEFDPAAANRITEHISRVLESADSASSLQRQVSALRTQLQDRRLLADAKSLLQRTCRMTEEQAYLHLRNTSRRERRPLRDVASELLETRGATIRATA